MISRILPGWALSPQIYAGLYPCSSEIYDFGFFSMQNGLEEFDSKLRKECTDSCIISAHSLGALLALGLTCELPTVKALIIYSGFAKFAKSADNPFGQPADTILAMKKQLEKNPHGIIKSFYRQMSYPGKYDFNVPEKLNIQALAQGLDMLLDCDNRIKAFDLKIPVLLIHGSDDRIANIRMAEELAANIKISRLHVFKNAGHAVPFTHLNESRAITEKFLRDYDLQQIG